MELTMDLTQIAVGVLSSGALGGGVSWLVSRKQRALGLKIDDAKLTEMLATQLKDVHTQLAECHDRHEKTDADRREYRRKTDAKLADLERQVRDCNERRHG
jgi:Spy/CpxP family protein refolding chaperone